MVSAHHKAFLEREEQIAKDRVEMEKRNIAHMEALAKEQPSPTPDEVRRALLGRAAPPEINVDESAMNNDPAKPEEEKPQDDKQPEDKVAKTSTAADPNGGKYKTRDLTAKK